MRITDAAKDVLTGILRDNPGKCLRVYFEGFGWGGPRLGLALDEPKKEETPVCIDSIDVLMEDDARLFTAAKVIDYIASKGGQGFVVLPEWGEERC